MKTGEKGLLETTESDLYMSYRNVMAASLWLALLQLYQTSTLVMQPGDLRLASPEKVWLLQESDQSRPNLEMFRLGEVLV